MATAIPVHASLDYVSSADWDTLPLLNTQNGLFGAVGALVGSLPSITAPNWLIQAGRVAVSPTAGNFTFTFPNAFPNGLLCVLMQPEDAGGVQSTIQLNSTSTKTTAVGIWWRPAGTGYTGSTVTVNFIAIGF